MNTIFYLMIVNYPIYHLNNQIQIFYPLHMQAVHKIQHSIFVVCGCFWFNMGSKNWGWTDFSEFFHHFFLSECRKCSFLHSNCFLWHAIPTFYQIEQGKIGSKFSSKLNFLQNLTKNVSFLHFFNGFLHFFDSFRQNLAIFAIFVIEPQTSDT